MAKSIVLVTVDCLRADHTGFMGYERPTTPFLDGLAGESYVFPAAIAAGAPTYYSLPAVMASRAPLALGRDVLGVAPGEPTLASVLREAGYATAAFSAANPYISSQFGYEQGFDTFRDFLDDDPAPEPIANHDGADGWASRLNRRLQSLRPAMGPLRVLYDEAYFRYCQRVTPEAKSLDALRRFPAADVIVDHALEWLASIGEAPFFLWLHLMDPHSPYYPTRTAIEWMGLRAITPTQARYLNSYWNRSDLGPARLAGHRDEVLGLYDAGIRWVDAQMARLVESLRRSKRWDDCIFALTADHGEEFLDHGGRYHAPSGLMEELIHVPLFLRVPGSGKMEVSKSPFSLVHLAPTLLEVVQLPAPAEFEGRDYLEALREKRGGDAVAISECVASCTNPFHAEKRMGARILSVREARFKFVLQFDPGVGHLYDLEADPGEQAPLAPSAQRAVRRRLLEIARQHLQDASRRCDVQMRVRARLRDLQLEWARSFPQRLAT